MRSQGYNGFYDVERASSRRAGSVMGGFWGWFVLILGYLDSDWSSAMAVLYSDSV